MNTKRNAVRLTDKRQSNFNFQTVFTLHVLYLNVFRRLRLRHQ